MKMKAVKYALLASLAGHGLHLPKEKHIEHHPSTRRGRKETSVDAAPGTHGCLNAIQEGLRFAADLCGCHRCH